jgi:DNA-binding response OmpR family regulator
MGHTQQFSVLLVEPHEDSREMYTAYLGHHGMTVHACEGSPHALGMAHVDAVVIAGRSSDALHLVEQLRAAPSMKDVPIVVLNGSASPDDAIRAAEVGCDCFVTIPHSPEELLMTVRRVIARRRFMTERQTPSSSAAAAHGSTQWPPPVNRAN